MFITFVYGLFILSLCGILMVLFFYPTILWVVSSFVENRKDKNLSRRGPSLSLSMIIALRNSEAIIEEKIKNCLSLRYPSENVEIIFSLDGSTDKTEAIIRSYDDERFKIISSPVHQGKVYALNRAAQKATHEILVFSDADSIIDTEAFLNLFRHFSEPIVGGVCGQRVIYRDKAEIRSAQKGYIRFDSMIKELECKIGSITSNDGKLYCIRKGLFRPIHTAAVDDLFVSLTVIRQGFLFVFEPDAKVFIRVPSRSPSHEIVRRRRIVSTSLRCLYLMREIFNPFRYGAYSFQLFVNKVLRRFLPFFLILFFFSNMALAFSSRWALGLLILQIGIYTLSALFPFLEKIPYRHTLLRKLSKISSLSFYFCVGNFGTLMGFIDFLLGRKIERWEPIKTQKTG